MGTLFKGSFTLPNWISSQQFLENKRLMTAIHPHYVFIWALVVIQSNFIFFSEFVQN